jgi:hypothetical protein
MRNVPFLKIPALLGGLSLALLLGACTTDGLVDPDLEGSASITVLDANTGLPVEDVKVEILGGDSKRTSEEGQTRFGALRLGAYQVRLSKTGYEASQEPLTVTSAGTQEVVAVNVSATYRVHKQGPSIKGRLFLHPQSGPDTSATIPARGVPVELRLSATGTGSGNTVYTTATRTVLTDSNGYYTFAKVPEISTYTLAVPEVSRSGKLYGQPATTLGAGTLIGNQVYTHTHIVMLPTAPPGLLQVIAPTTTLTANQNWVFEFSAGVDTSRFAAATAIQLRANAVNVNSTRTWSQGFKVLSIKPAVGTWAAATTYSVVLTGVRDSTNRVLTTTTFTATPTP